MLITVRWMIRRYRAFGGNGTNKFLIKEMFVRAVDDDTITVEVYIYRPQVEERESVQMLCIDKNLINGIVVEEI